MKCVKKLWMGSNIITQEDFALTPFEIELNTMKDIPIYDHQQGGGESQEEEEKQEGHMGEEELVEYGCVLASQQKKGLLKLSVQRRERNWLENASNHCIRT